MNNLRLLIDGNSLTYRSMFAQDDLSVNIGDTIVHTGIPYGFLRTLIDVINQIESKETHVFWDGGSYRKKKIYPDYKSNRKELTLPEGMTWDDVNLSIKVCRKLLRYTGASQYLIKGEEADDAIGSYCAQNKDEPIVVLTSDHDLLQLTKHKHVRVLRFNHRDAMKMWDKREFIREHGFEPRYYPHYLSIVGDKTDAIPGVKGVGPKTADKMFTGLDKPTLKNIYDNLDTFNLTEGVKKKMLVDMDNTRIFLKITKLLPDLTLKPIASGPDREKLVELLKSLKFISILKDEENVECLINA